MVKLIGLVVMTHMISDVVSWLMLLMYTRTGVVLPNSPWDCPQNY